MSSQAMECPHVVQFGIPSLLRQPPPSAPQFHDQERVATWAAAIRRPSHASPSGKPHMRSPAPTPGSEWAEASVTRAPLNPAEAVKAPSLARSHARGPSVHPQVPSPILFLTVSRLSPGFLKSANPEGCQKLAGGSRIETPEKSAKKLFAPRKGCQNLAHLRTGAMTR